MKTYLMKVYTLNLLVISFNAYSAPTSFADKVEHLRTLELDLEVVSKSSAYSQKYQVQKLEPKFCPFNSTGNESLEKSLAVLAKGFDGDCLGESNEFAKKLVNESVQLETAIKDNPHMSSNASMTSYLDQNKINTIFAGLDAALSFESCSDEKKKSLLNRSSSVLRSIAQLGLYSASTTTSSTSYGLLIASSALTFIDNLLERGFSFGDKQDIKTFKELNCSYYDIRQKLKSINFYKRPTVQMQQDYKDVNQLITKIDTSINKEVTSIKNIIETKISKASSLEAKNISKDIKSIDNIINFLPLSLKKSNDVFEVLDYLVINYKLIKDTVSSHYLLPKPPLSRISYSNRNFKTQLDKVGDINKADSLASLSIKEFSETFYISLRDHLIRISKDMKLRKEKLIKDFHENGIFTIEAQNYHIATLKGQMNSERLKNVLKKTELVLNQLKKSKEILYSIVKRKVQSRQDSFDNGDENIIELSRKLNDHLYGKLGDKFIDAVNEDATISFKEYKVQIERLIEIHFDGTYSTTLQDTGDSMIHNFCVASQDVIELATLGSTQIERAYDFFATNDYLIRQSKGRVILSSPRENLHENSQAALKAKEIREIIRNNHPTLLDVLDQSLIEEINGLNTSWWKADSVGHNMIKATMAERDVIWLEKVRDLYSCSSQHLIRFND